MEESIRSLHNLNKECFRENGTSNFFKTRNQRYQFFVKNKVYVFL